MVSRLRTLLGRSAARHPTARLALLAALAATVAWTAGALLPMVSPLVAGITALIAVRPTFHDSLAETVRQVVGTVLGAAAAAGVVLTVGFSPVTLFGAVLASYATARLLRLGADAAPTIAITVLLVVAVNLDEQQVEARFLGVLLGALTGLTVSWWTRPGSPTSRALADSLRQADRLADLLTEVSAGLAGRADGRPVDLAAAGGGLDRAGAISQDLVATRLEAEEAVRAARWAPGLRRAEAEQVLAQVRLSQATATTVLGTCRDLVAAALDDRLPAPVSGSLSEVFAAAAGAISRQADHARTSPAHPLAADTTAVQDLVEARQEAVATIRQADTQPLLLGGSLLADGARITRLLTDRSGD